MPTHISAEGIFILHRASVAKLSHQTKITKEVGASLATFTGFCGYTVCFQVRGKIMHMNKGVVQAYFSRLMLISLIQYIKRAGNAFLPGKW